jgi:hypothetical protein
MLFATVACTAQGAGGSDGSTPARSVRSTVTAGISVTAGSSGTASTPATDSADSSAPAIAASDLAAIKAAIDAINATAGGSVAAQRSELTSLAAPDELAKQRACPAAHSTLAFQPAYRDLRPAPADPDTTHGSTPAGADGSPSAAPAMTAGSATATAGSSVAGVGYLLPAFITIYTGNRITGTDLTTLHLWVIGGTARTGALCVS